VTSADDRIVEGLARATPQAIEMLYDRYGTLAYTLAYRVLNDEGAAQDVVQETFLTIWRRASTYEPSRGSLRSWLCSIVRSRAIDRLRGRSGRARRDLHLEDVPMQTAPSDTWDRVAAELEREHVSRALTELPPDQRQTIELAYYGGYSQREISDLMQVPLGTVKGRTRMALRKLRALVEGEGLGLATT
jgi:RNA polymerase sigma-70 factor (ECF subfamily)